MLVVILCQNITSQFHYDNLRKLQFSFFTYLGQTKFWKFVCLFDMYKLMNQSNFEVILLDNVLINGDYLKIQNGIFVENSCMRRYDFYMTDTRNETATRKTLF